MEGDGDEEVASLGENIEQPLNTPSHDLAAVSNIPAKRKAEESSSPLHDGDNEEGAADISAYGERDVQDASRERTPVQTKTEVETIAPPAKKKSKSSKAEERANANSKDVRMDDRSSVATDDIGTPDIPTVADLAVAESSSAATKKAPKKKAAAAASSGATKGKKTKKKTTAAAALSGQSSNASTPSVADREESTALPDIEEDEEQRQKQDGSSEESEKLYCICKTLYDDESMMIACDRCDEWYHTLCMKMSEDQVKLVDIFICPYCEPLTALRTTWKEQCARPGCTNAALPPLTRYCGEECGMLLAASRIAKLTKQQMKGITPQGVAEKLSAQQIVTASKREGVTLWEEQKGQERRKWLASVLLASGKKKEKQVSVTAADLDGMDLDEEAKLKVDDMAELEILSRLQSRRRHVARLREGVNTALDAFSARTKLLHLAEDRVPTLEPIQQDEADDGGENRTKSSKKSSSSKKSKGNNGAEEGQSAGQPRCGYDDRLNWENSRFHAWCQTDKAKAMLDEREALDGTLITDEEGKAALPADQVAICGRSRRKCKRHVDWSVIRSAEMEVDRDVQTNLLSALDDEEQEVKGQLEQVQTRIKDTLSRQQVEARERDALLALQLAHEGTRRAIQPL